MRFGEVQIAKIVNGHDTAQPWAQWQSDRQHVRGHEQHIGRMQQQFSREAQVRPEARERDMPEGAVGAERWQRGGQLVAVERIAIAAVALREGGEQFVGVMFGPCARGNGDPADVDPDMQCEALSF